MKWCLSGKPLSGLLARDRADSCVYWEEGIEHRLSAIKKGLGRQLRNHKGRTMKVIIDRDLCDANLAFCQRCSAAFIRFPEGVDRHCIREIIEDDKETLTIEMRTDGRILELELTEEERDLASVEGWEVLADFDPALFRTGAADRWRELRHLPVN